MRSLANACTFLMIAAHAAASLIPANSVVLCGGSGPTCQTLVAQSTPINLVPTAYTNGGSSVTVSATVNDDSTGLVLKALASYNNLAGTYYTQMNAVAQFSDTVTISSTVPGVNGTVGYLEMPFAVSGSTTAFTALGQVFTFVDGVESTCYFTNNGVLITGELSQSSCSSSDGQVTTGGPGALLSFHYGTLFTLSWGLSGDVFPESGLSSGTADYSDTATLSGLLLFTSQGVNLTGPNVTIQTSGGETFAALSTPEPRDLIPCLVGVAGLLALRRRNSCRQS